MALTLADKVTLARIGLLPLIVAAYLFLPIEHGWCLWVAGALCGLAEYSDFVDGRIARQRGEVSDFGKLADPFCDVFYRIGVFMVLLLPAGGVGWVVGEQAIPMAGHHGYNWYDQVARADVHQLVIATGPGQLGAGLMPFWPVLLMVLREIIAGALRAMTATRGLVLAARTSGKVKAWLQGVTIIFFMGWACVFFNRSAWILEAANWAAWICAVVSVASIIEYIWVNRAVLAQMAVRRA